ncbi:ROK family transcriptional regulator [Microbacterium jejuense]|uniref:ROK family transcriptional regulator n=1 Tax=Microbacterium jejuense TaxID=1263637 RepID=UPI0031EADCF8
MPLATPDVRRHNLGLVLGRVLEGAGEARADIAAATGLSRGAVTSLVAELIEAGLVEESEVVAPAGMGRPRTMLAPAASAPCFVTAMVDADHATAVASTLAGDELTRVSLRHGRPMGDPGAIAGVLAEAVDAVAVNMDAASRRIADVCVIVWAPVGGSPARVLADTDLGWGEVDLLGLLRARSAALARYEGGGGQARLVPDSDVAALAEHAAVGGETLLYLKADSGIGGAIVLTDADGARVLGAALGHLPVVPGGVRCECGQHGCLVTVAGPDALLSRSGLGALAAEKGLTAALEAFVARVQQGAEPAASVWREAAGEIARTLQIVALTVAPDVIVLGGFMAALAADVDAVFRTIQPHIAHAPVLPIAPVIGSALGADAALRGAQRDARMRLLADPLAI